MAYTDAMVAKLHAAAPLDLAKAQALGGELGVSYRSVISKAKQLGIEYVAKAPAARQAKDTGPTKADILAELRTRINSNRDGDLSKAELADLLGLLL